MARTFSTTSTKCSKELTKKESVLLKDTSDALTLNDAVQGEPIILKPVMWAELAVHNEKAKDAQSKDYDCYLIVDDNGHKYKTGSQAFWNAFIDIWEDMEDSDEPWELKVYKLPSKNGNFQDFITCSII